MRRSLKDLCSAYYMGVLFAREVRTMPAECLGMKRARELLGRRPTRLSLLRGALRYWAENEPRPPRRRPRGGEGRGAAGE